MMDALFLLNFFEFLKLLTENIFLREFFKHLQIFLLPSGTTIKLFGILISKFLIHLTKEWP